MLESLEPRLLNSHAVDTSSVGLFNPDGSPAVLDASRDTWLVIHGIDSSKDDDGFQTLAQAVQLQSPDHQVLLVGWGQLAATGDHSRRVTNARAVGDTVAAMLRTAGVAGMHVNLIGFSMGCYVEQQIASDLRHVNRLVAIDPSDGGGLAAHSAYSVAFQSVMDPKISFSARDVIQFKGLPGNGSARHVEAFLAFRTMMLRDAGIESASGDDLSGVFSISNILTGNLPAWRRSSASGGFNANLTLSPVPGSEFDYAPVQLKYVDRSGQKIFY